MKWEGRVEDKIELDIYEYWFEVDSRGNFHLQLLLACYFCSSFSFRKLILNLMHFGYKVLNEESVKTPKSKIKPKERPGEKYETSRWTPLLQDIAEVYYYYYEIE